MRRVDLNDAASALLIHRQHLVPRDLRQGKGQETARQIRGTHAARMHLQQAIATPQGESRHAIAKHRPALLRRAFKSTAQRGETPVVSILEGIKLDPHFRTSRKVSQACEAS